ncbi:hypothetical protein C0J52_27926, partial [Blattella germanica]
MKVGILLALIISGAQGQHDRRGNGRNVGSGDNDRRGNGRNEKSEGQHGKEGNEGNRGLGEHDGRGNEGNGRSEGQNGRGRNGRNDESDERDKQENGENQGSKDGNDGSKGQPSRGGNDDENGGNERDTTTADISTETSNTDPEESEYEEFLKILNNPEDGDAVIFNGHTISADKIRIALGLLKTQDGTFDISEVNRQKLYEVLQELIETTTTEPSSIEDFTTDETTETFLTTDIPSQEPERVPYDEFLNLLSNPNGKTSIIFNGENIPLDKIRTLLDLELNEDGTYDISDVSQESLYDLLIELTQFTIPETSSTETLPESSSETLATDITTEDTSQPEKVSLNEFLVILSNPDDNAFIVFNGQKIPVDELRLLLELKQNENGTYDVSNVTQQKLLELLIELTQKTTTEAINSGTTTTTQTTSEENSSETTATDISTENTSQPKKVSLNDFLVILSNPDDNTSIVFNGQKIPVDKLRLLLELKQNKNGTYDVSNVTQQTLIELLLKLSQKTTTEAISSETAVTEITTEHSQVKKTIKTLEECGYITAAEAENVDDLQAFVSKVLNEVLNRKRVAGPHKTRQCRVSENDGESTTTSITPIESTTYAVYSTNEENYLLLITRLKECGYIKEREEENAHDLSQFVDNIVQSIKDGNLKAKIKNEKCSPKEIDLLLELVSTMSTQTFTTTYSSTDTATKETTQQSEIEKTIKTLEECGYITAAEADNVDDLQAFVSKVLNEVLNRKRVAGPHRKRQCRVSENDGESTTTSITPIESTTYAVFSTNEENYLLLITRLKECGYIDAQEAENALDLSQFVDNIVQSIKDGNLKAKIKNKKCRPKEIELLLELVSTSSTQTFTTTYSSTDTATKETTQQSEIEKTIKTLEECGYITAAEADNVDDLQAFVSKVLNEVLNRKRVAGPHRKRQCRVSENDGESTTTSITPIESTTYAVSSTNEENYLLLITRLQECGYIDAQEAENALDLKLKQNKNGTYDVSNVTQQTLNELLLKLSQKTTTEAISSETAVTEITTEHSQVKNTIKMLEECGYITAAEADNVDDLQAFVSKVLNEVLNKKRVAGPHKKRQCRVSENDGESTTTSITPFESTTYAVSSTNEENYLLIITRLKECGYIDGQEAENALDLSQFVDNIVQSIKDGNLKAKIKNKKCRPKEIELLLELVSTSSTQTFTTTYSSTDTATKETTQQSEIEKTIKTLEECGYITAAEADNVDDLQAFVSKVLNEVLNRKRVAGPHRKRQCRVSGNDGESTTTSITPIESSTYAVSSTNEENYLLIITRLKECGYIDRQEAENALDLSQFVDNIVQSIKDGNLKAKIINKHCSTKEIELLLEQVSTHYTVSSITTHPFTTDNEQMSPNSTISKTQLELIITWLKECHYLKTNETQDSKEIQRIVQEILNGTRTSDVIATGVSNNCSRLELLLLIENLQSTSLRTTEIPSPSSTEYTSATTTKTSKIELLLLCGYITKEEAEG